MKLIYTTLASILFMNFLLVSCKSEPSFQQASTIKFDEFSLQFMDEYWKMFPEAATLEGNHAYDEVLSIPNPDRRRDVVAWNQKQLDKLKLISVSELSDEERVDYELIKNRLERSMWYSNYFKAYEWNLSNYNLGRLFFYTLKGEESLEQRLRNASVRLYLVPEYYAAAKNNTTFPVLEQVELAIQQIPSSLDVLETAVLDSLELSSLEQEESELLQSRVAAAKLAIEDYVDYLNELVQSNEQFRTFRIGKELYSKKFALDINSGLSAEENYQAALQAKQDVHNQMLELSNVLWSKYFPDTQQPEGLEATKQLIEALSASHTTKDHFVDEVRQQIPELVEFINQKDLLYLDPSKPLIVRETPKYIGGFSLASISAPGPFDKDGDTYYNVSPIDQYSDEQANSLLEEYNDYMLQILNIHEAIPGHYTQLVYANKSPSLVKSVFGNGAMIEGWACFAERMMLENGYGDGPEKDELMLMYYKWNLRIIANSIIDYGIHVENWSKEQVLDLLINEAFQEQEEALGKWKRATLSSVQLTSYFNGLTEIQQLKNEVEAKQGDDFSIKQFNEEFLSYGSSPVRLIAELMLKD